MLEKPLFKKGWSFLKKFILAVGALCLCACSIQKERVALSDPLDIDSSIQEAFLAKDFVPSDWVDENWWEMFKDPQLNQFILTTLEKNPTMQSAIETVTLAQDAAKETFSPLLPSLSAHFNEDFIAFDWKRTGLKYREPILPSDILPNWINYLGTMLSFKWVLDIWGKQDKLYKAALDDMKGELANAAYTKLMLSVQVAKCYISLQYQLKKQTHESQILQSYQNLLKIQKQRVLYALADEMDLIQLKKKIVSLEEETLNTTKAIATSQHQLKVYMGLSPSDPDPLQEPSAEFNMPFPFPSQVSSDLLARRPDIVSKIWAIQAAMKRVNSAKVEFLPAINLSSFSGYFTFTYKELLEPRAWFTSILPGATLPLFKGLKLRSKLKYRLRQYNLAVYDYNQLLLSAAQDIVDSITSFRIVNQQLDQHETLLDESRQNVDLTTMRYQYGLDSYLEVLYAEIIWQKDLMTYDQFFEMRLLSILNLIKSVGGGYDCPQAQVDIEKDFIYE